MNYEVSSDTRMRLCWHAGLEHSARSHGVSIADATGPDAATAGRLSEAMADALATLARLNHELNGPIPSQNNDGANHVPRQLAYAIAEILVLLRDGTPSSEAARTIETAWLAVLAGDIDDIEQHVRDERATRDR